MMDKKKTTTIIVSEEAFNSHMKRKADIWDPEFMHLGTNFAVMEFNNLFQLTKAYNDSLSYNNYYDYMISKDEISLQLSFVNGFQIK